MCHQEGKIYLFTKAHLILATDLSNKQDPVRTMGVLTRVYFAGLLIAYTDSSPTYSSSDGHLARGSQLRNLLCQQQAADHQC